MTPLKNDNHDRVLGHDDRTCERCYWKGRELKAESLLEEKPTTSRLVVFTRNGPCLHVNDPGEWGIDDDGNFIAWHDFEEHVASALAVAAA